VRRVCVCAFIVACKGEAKPPPPSPPPPTIDGAIVVDAMTSDAAVIDAAISPGPPKATLVLDVTPTKRIVVTPSGPVMIDGKPVELAKLGGKVRRTMKPGTFGEQYDEMDGMLLVRVEALGKRPVLVVDGELPAIRLFEVAAAMQPVGPAIEVIDSSGKPRAFAFRFGELTDKNPLWRDPADPMSSEESLLIQIDRTGFHVGTTLPDDRHLPLTATLDELKAAVVAVLPESKFGFVDLEGANQPTALALLAIEALAGAKAVGVSFIAGSPGIPSLSFGAPNKLVRRAVGSRAIGPHECYKTWLDDNPGRGGRVELQFRLDGGVLKNPKATQFGLDDKLLACIADVYKEVEIKEQTEPAIVKIWLEPDGGTKRR
jgi:hypothetical protein